MRVFPQRGFQFVKEDNFLGRAQTFGPCSPLCPREEAVFVHKIARSLLIAGLGYRVQNWKLEAFNQGKWKLPPLQG